jgi:vacuolar-type H+-ATPase subunit E/Vma4
MSEHIQPLLERIQSEGLKKAESERETLLEQARTEADGIVESAKREAEEIRQQAESDAESTRRRGQATLEQAARDLLLRLRTEINRQLTLAAHTAASSALSSTDLVAALIQERVKSTSGEVTVETNPELGEQLKALLPALLKDAGAAGGQVVMHPKSGAGFELRFSDSAEGVDVSAEAVADWLSSLVRPGLASLLKPEADTSGD